MTRDVGFEPPTFHRMRRTWLFEIHGSEMGVRDRDMHGMENLYRVTCQTASLIFARRSVREMGK